MDASFYTNSSGLEKLYWILAIAGSLAVGIQMILVFLMEVEAEFDHPGGGSDTTGLQIFSIKNLSAFFCIFGWSGLSLIHHNYTTWSTLAISGCLGTIMMAVMAGLMYGLYQLRSDGTVDLNRIETNIPAKVYLRIPATGVGKVSFTYKNKNHEIPAVSSDRKEIPTGTPVTIVKITNNTAIVERKA